MDTTDLFFYHVRPVAQPFSISSEVFVWSTAITIYDKVQYYVPH